MVTAIRLTLLGGACGTSVLGAFVVAATPSVIARAMQSENYASLAAPIAAVVMLPLTVMLLAVPALSLQRVSVDPEGFAPLFRPLRSMRRPFRIPWSSVVWIDKEPHLVGKGDVSYYVYREDGKVYGLHSRAFGGDAEALRRHVDRIIEELSSASRWKKPAKWAAFVR